MSELDSLVKIYPSVWDGKDLEVQPGDLSKFALAGVGISGPLPIRPWDDPVETAEKFNNYYGYNDVSLHPFHNVSINEYSGGVIYFDSRPDLSTIQSVFQLMGVNTGNSNYAVFMEQAGSPIDEKYLVQLRIVSRSALMYVFNALDNEEYDTFPPQKIPVGELLEKFILNQQDRWGTGMGSPALRGLMGGDDDWAKEALAFGFVCENVFYGIYRIWSRAWLVTK